ncbi:MAG: NUDIX hydrolase [Firmicutes bacterium]|nr:NUDIX hydrolase [Bacillota bacterium]
MKETNAKEIYTREERIEFINSDFFYRMKHLVENDRKGEVVFCIIRPNGKIITITCEEYPKGIYRIPSGGIGYGEDIENAVFREVKEELGLEVEIIDYIGWLKIEFQYKDEKIKINEKVIFYSYLFILKEVGGMLLSGALDDEISEVREVDLKELADIVESLNNIEGKWRDWGKFRYVTSKAILDYLTNTRYG